MDILLTGWSPLTALAGLMVGTIVGITGVGGGALMTPLLVLLFGVAPATAVGTDLLYAAITKTFGLGVHHRSGTVDWKVVRRLACGSLPAVAATLAWMNWNGAGQVKSGFIVNAVAVAIIVTALGLVMRGRLQSLGRYLQMAEPSRFMHWQPLLTAVAGAVLGVLITLTSIGAGALGTVILVYLYPTRLNNSKLVGTDIAHAIPLALFAGCGHLVMGNVDYPLLGNLLSGSIPGVLVGSFIATRSPVRFIRCAVALVLAAVAVKMLAI